MTDTAKAATTNTPTKAGAGSASTAARTPAEPSILSRVAAARYAQTAEGTQTHVPIAKARETLAKSASEGHGDTAAQTVSIGLPEHGPGAQAQSQEQTSSRPQVDASANASAARTVATAGSKANGVTAPRTGLPSAPANALAGRAYRPAPPTTKVPDPASCPVPSEAMCSGAQTSGTAKPGVGPQAATAKPRQAGIEVQPSRSDNATRILPDRKGESRSAPPKDELPRGAQESGLPKSPVPMRPRTGYPVTDAQTPVLNEAPRATPQNQASSPQPRGSRPVQTGEGPWVRSAGAQVSPSLQTPRQARPAASPASGASPLPSTTPLPRSTSPHPRATPSSTAASQQRPSPPPASPPTSLPGAQQPSSSGSAAVASARPQPSSSVALPPSQSRQSPSTTTATAPAQVVTQRSSQPAAPDTIRARRNTAVVPGQEHTKPLPTSRQDTTVAPRLDTDSPAPNVAPSPPAGTSASLADTAQTKPRATPAKVVASGAPSDGPEAKKQNHQGPSRAGNLPQAPVSSPPTGQPKSAAPASSPAASPQVPSRRQQIEDTSEGTAKQSARAEAPEGPAAPRTKSKRTSATAGGDGDGIDATPDQVASSKALETPSAPSPQGQASPSSKDTVTPPHQPQQSTRPEPTTVSSRTVASEPAVLPTTSATTSTTAEQTTFPAPVPALPSPLPLTPTPTLPATPIPEFSSITPPQVTPIASDAATIYQRAAEDSGLAVTVLPHVAHLSFNSDEGDLSLHVRVRDGNADVNVSGSMAPVFESKAPEMRTILADQGLGLSSFAADQHGQGRHSQQHPEATPSESHPSHSTPATRTRTPAVESTVLDEGRIHITA